MNQKVSLEKEETGKSSEESVLCIILCSVVFVTCLFTFFETWSNATQADLKFIIQLSMTLIFLPSFLECWDYRHVPPYLVCVLPGTEPGLCVCCQPSQQRYLPSPHSFGLDNLKRRRKKGQRLAV